MQVVLGKIFPGLCKEGAGLPAIVLDGRGVVLFGNVGLASIYSVLAIRIWPRFRF